MKKSFKYSLAIHIIVIAICYLKLPFFQKQVPHEQIINISLVKSGPITNLPNSTQTDKSKKSNIKESVVSKKIPIINKTQADNPAVVKKEGALPKKPIEEPKAIPKKPAEEKKKPKKVEDDQGDFEELLKELDKKSIGAPKKSKTSSSSGTSHDVSLPMTISEKDNIKYQIEQKFTSPVVSDFKPGELIIKLRLEMSETGNIERVIELSGSKYRSEHERVFNMLKTSLIKAAYLASPLKNLPREKYNGNGGWNEIELSFDAHYLMNY